MRMLTITKCIMLLVISACTTEQSALQRGVESQPITAYATEACSRRIAQLAAPYGARGITSYVARQAELLPDGRYILTFAVKVEYTQETKTGAITCIVTDSGRVDQLTGMKG